MPSLSGTDSPGKRLRGGLGGRRLSTRARVVAGAVAACAVLAVLAVAAVSGPGHRARVPAASRTPGAAPDAALPSW